MAGLRSLTTSQLEERTRNVGEGSYPVDVSIGAPLLQCAIHSPLTSTSSRIESQLGPGNPAITVDVPRESVNGFDSLKNLLEAIIKIVYLRSVCPNSDFD